MSVKTAKMNHLTIEVMRKVRVLLILEYLEFKLKLPFLLLIINDNLIFNF